LESRAFSLANTTFPSTKNTSTSCAPVSASAARSGLVSDQLEDVGDAEVLERPREGHYAPPRALAASRSRKQIAYTRIRTADVNPTRAKETPLFTASGFVRDPRQNTSSPGATPSPP